MKKQSKKILNFIFITLFVAIIFLPSILMFAGLTSFDESVEKRQAAAKPQLTLATITSFPEEYDNYFNDYFGLRTQLIRLYANIKNSVFKTSSSDTVLWGKNGFFYYTLVQNINLYYGDYGLYDNFYDKLLYTQQAVSEYYASQGKEYVVVLAPSKVSVYPEYLPDGGVSAPDKSLIDNVSNLLSTNVNVVNLKPTLLADKDKNLLYYKTDTHWNDYGTFYGYLEVCKNLESLNIMKDFNQNVTFEPGTYPGEFGAILGSDYLKPEKCDYFKADGTSEEITTGDNYNKFVTEVQKDTTFYYGKMLKGYKDYSDKNLVVFHDSYFNRDNFKNLFASNFNTTTFYYSDKKMVLPDVVNAVDADVIMFESTERFIPYMAQDLDPKIKAALASPVTNPSATIENLQFDKDTYKLGETVKGKITITNTSKDTYSFANDVKLCAALDGTALDWRAYIPMDDPILPGETQDVEFEYTPTVRGTHTFSLALVAEGVSYFGNVADMQYTVK